MGKTCAINVTDKGLICRICKELLQIKRKGRDNLKAKKKKEGNVRIGTPQQKTSKQTTNIE